MIHQYSSFPSSKTKLSFFCVYLLSKRVLYIMNLTAMCAESSFNPSLLAGSLGQLYHRKASSESERSSARKKKQKCCLLWPRGRRPRYYHRVHTMLLSLD